MTGYTDYVYNLDKLTVYVTSKPVENDESLQVHDEQETSNTVFPHIVSAETILFFLIWKS